MRDTLYIQLRDAAPEAPVAHAWVSGPPGGSVPVSQAPLAEVLARAAGKRIVLFVPGIDVRLTQVQVPARQAQKVLQAAPYALEDQLAEDVDTLHFAIAPPSARRRAGDPHPVAVVARARMEQWLVPLRERALKADAVVPETLCLPAPEPGLWSVLAEAGRVTVRSGAYNGFSCTLGDFESYLQLADPQGQAALRLLVARDVDYDFTRLGRQVELLPGHASALEVLVRHWQPDNAINLLQGSYSAKQDWQGAARPWRLAAGLAAVWIAIALIGTAVEGFRTSRELQRQEQANLERWQALFPAETRTENLSLLVQQKLVAARSGGGTQAPMLGLLGVLSESLTATPGLTLQSLQFREGALYLSLTGSDLQALENLRAWYGTRPDTLLSVTDTNAAPDGVQVRLKLTPA